MTPNNSHSKAMISPKDFLKELTQIKLDIQAEKLTPEGRHELLEQVNQLEAMVLELKNILLDRERSSE